ncbi:MAG: YpdA family putative bacillithiol disulfide reductase [Bacteroidota bacterium]
MKKVFDVAVVGAGPIGLACGIEAQKKKLSHIIFDKGCLVNSIYHYPVNMTFFSTSEKIEIGEVPFISHTPRPTRREALEYYRRVQKKWALNVHTYERVHQVLPSERGLPFTLETAKGRYQAHTVIIATGFYDKPHLIGVPGEDLPKVKHYYDDPHPYIDQKVLVVGAANSAIDAALETWRKGASVSLVVRKEAISHRVKYWIKPDIENRIKEGSIQAYYSSTVQEIREKEVDLLTPEGVITIENDFVLAMTGFEPDFSWLENIGIQCSDDPMRYPKVHEETFETHIPHLYLAGTVCGGMHTNKWFIENSIVHASTVMEDIIGKLEERVDSYGTR